VSDIEDALIWRLDVRQAARQLKPRERGMLTRFVRGDTATDIARADGLSRERVGQILATAGHRLRHALRSPPGFDRPAFLDHMARLLEARRIQREQEAQWEAAREAREREAERYSEERRFQRDLDAMRALIEREGPAKWIVPAEAEIEVDAMLAFASALASKPPPPKPKPPEWLRLLYIPESDRADQQKRSLALLLEQEFIRRGAGPLIPTNPDAAEQHASLSPEDRAMAKYNWYAVNLDAMFSKFPPYPGKVYFDP
jgi:DNA-binding CsgD family transcriptional regulator